MSARVLTVNLASSAEPNPAKGVGRTGHGKAPVESAVLRAPGPKRGGRGSGLVGDVISDLQHHGGDRQAVYAYAREELDAWETRLGRELSNGTFGENLTTSGLDVDGALIGERWRVGDEVVLAVCGPRVPCVTFAYRMRLPGWLKTFTEVGRSGAYLSIEAGGTVRPGDAIQVLSRPEHSVDVALTFRAFMGDLDAARAAIAGKCLPDDEVEWLRDRVVRRS
ncbi:MOSC domain-containing protein [Nocardioides dilutus]